MWYKNLVMFGVVMVLILLAIFFFKLTYDQVRKYASESLIYGGDLNNRNYWLTHGQNATIRDDGVADFFVNDTEGKWLWSKIQQGILPNDWTRKDTVNEINVTLDNMPDVYARVIGNFSGAEFYNETESWVNVGVCFWFQINPDYDSIESVQMVVDVRFVSLKNNETVTEDIAFNNGMYDNEYHYLTTSPETFSLNGEYCDVTVKVSDAWQRAFSHWGVDKGTLKCVEYYIEAYYGSGQAQLDFIDVWYEPSSSTNSTFIEPSVFLPILLPIFAVIEKKGG